MDGASATRPPVSREPASRDRRHTRVFLAVLYLLAVALGIGGVARRESNGHDLLDSIVCSVGLGWWAIVDARVRGHVIPLLSKSWFLLFSFFLVPGYIVWSRGWRGAGWIVLIGATWTILAAISSFLADAILRQPGIAGG